MPRTLIGTMLALGLLVSSGQTAAFAGGALIETTAPLPDRSEESVKAAVVAAIDKAVRGAVAMGFAWFQLRDAQISGNQVAIQILATDEKPAGEHEGGPDEGSDAAGEDEDLTEDPPPEVPIAAGSRVHI